MTQTKPHHHKNIDIATDIPYKTVGILEKPLGWFSQVGNQTFHQPEQFNWCEEIEDNWLDIRDELLTVLQESGKIPGFQEISTSQARLTKGDDWKTFLFYGYGYKLELNCQQCPKTTALLERIPGMKTAFFSILAPHKHIPAHRGPYKGVLRYHLGLIIPDKNLCTIRVGSDFGHWEDGKSLIFDDSFEHEVWNDTDQMRVVLFVDFLRPLPFPISLLNKAVVKLISWTPFVRTALKRSRALEQELLRAPSTLNQ